MVFYVNVVYIFYLIYMYTCLPCVSVLFWFHWAAQQKLFILRPHINTKSMPQ